MRAASSLAIACVLAWVTPAVAQNSQAAATIQFDQGRALMKQGKYKKACTAFENSQKLDAQNGTLFNLAECHVHLGKLATAWLAYRDLGQKDTNAGRAKEANRRAKDLEKRLPKLLIRIEAPPPGLAVTINAIESTALVGIESPVDLGEYEIHATAPGFAAFETTTSVTAEGKTVKVTLELEESTAPTPGPKEKKKKAIEPVDDPRPTSHRKRNGAIITIAGGGLLVVGTVFGLRAQGDWSDAEAICPDHACINVDAKQQGDELVDSARGNATISTAFVVGGVAVAAIGIYLVATAPSSRSTSAMIAPTQGGATVVLGGRF